MTLAQSSFLNLTAIISWFTCLKTICMLFHLGINFYLFWAFFFSFLFLHFNAVKQTSGANDLLGI